LSGRIYEDHIIPLPKFKRASLCSGTVPDLPFVLNDRLKKPDFVGIFPSPAQPLRQNGVGDDTGTPDESLAAA
jgi:hypothetical protein